VGVFKSNVCFIREYISIIIESELLAVSNIKGPWSHFSSDVLITAFLLIADEVEVSELTLTKKGWMKHETNCEHNLHEHKFNSMEVIKIITSRQQHNTITI
jgi:hypothetical protein